MVPSELALGEESTPSLEAGGASPADDPNQEQLLPINFNKLLILAVVCSRRRP